MPFLSQRSAVSLPEKCRFSPREVALLLRKDFLDDVWERLAEAGMGGYDDGDDHLNTDISDKPADEPSRSR